MRRISALALAACISAAPGIGLAAPCAGFTDVESASPFCSNVAWMKNRNITVGCGANLYCPNDFVTRLQIAPFLNRLGDTVLPPNVVWVAPLGGQYHSIQAAIDALAPAADAGTHPVVRVAPGYYYEQVTMKPWVDVEGSGENSTFIISDACSHSQYLPPAATVQLHGTGHLRNVNVQNIQLTSSPRGNYCTALYGPGVAESVTAVASGATVAAYGMLTAKGGTYRRLTLAASGAPIATAFSGSTPIASGHQLTLEDVRATAWAGPGGDATALEATGFVQLNNVTAEAIATSGGGQVVALALNAAIVTGERIRATAIAASPVTTSSAIRVQGILLYGSISLRNVFASAEGATNNAAIRNDSASLKIADAELAAQGGSSSYAIMTSTGATTMVANALLAAPGAVSITAGAIKCFNAYNGAFDAVSCP